MNLDGFAEIFTGPASGGGPHVRSFDGLTGAPLLSFFAFPEANKMNRQFLAGSEPGQRYPRKSSDRCGAAHQFALRQPRLLLRQTPAVAAVFLRLPCPL